MTRSLRGWLVAIAVVLPAVVLVPDALDAYAMPKVAAMLFAAVVLTAGFATDVIDHKRLRVVWGAPAAVATALACAGVVITLTSGHPWRSFIGARGRGDGLLVYLVALLLFAVVASWLEDGDIPLVLLAVAALGAVEAVLGLAQAAGVGLLRETTVYGSSAVLGTIGNPNFVSGVLAITLPASAWVSLAAHDRRLRLAGAAAVVLSGVAILASRSFQGVVAGAVGVSLPLAGLALGRFGDQRRRVFAGIGAIAVAGASVLVVGFLGHGPLGHALNDVGRLQRVRFWQVGLRMFGDHPVTGLGFSRFGEFYRVYRRPTDAVYGIFESADEPHNVVLGMFVNGGLILGLAYLAFVAATGIALLRAVRAAADDARRLLVLSVAGVWLAYQVQSVVSIDNQPLPGIHFIISGLVIVLAGSRRVLWQSRPASGRQARRQQQQAPLAPRLAVGGAALVAAWFALVPLRAELATRSARRAEEAGDGNAAVANMRRAARLLPHEPAYQAETGRLLVAGGAMQLALPYYERAAEEEPRTLPYVIPYARILAATGSTDQARRWYERALKLEPNVSTLKLEVAKFELVAGGGAAAERWANIVRRLAPNDPDTYLVLGDAYRLQGDFARSDRNYDRALELRPDDLGLLGRLADTAQRAGRYERELELRMKFAAAAPGADSWDKVGIVLEKLGRRADAIEAYRKALADVRTDAIARAALERFGFTLPLPF